MRTLPNKRRFPWAAAAVALLLICSIAGAVPQLQPVNGQSLQAGTTTALVLEGSDLLPAPRLFLPIPMLKQTVRPGGTANRIEIEVQLPGDIAPGIYQLRLGNTRGISNPVAVSVDDLPNSASAVAALPASVRGAVAGTDIFRTSFLGRKGDRIVVDLECRRLGSSLDPVVELLAPGPRLLALGQGQTRLQGDVRFEAELPTDGTYTVEVHDALFQGAAPGFFRLKLGNLHYADTVFPLGVQRGQPGAIQFLGRLPADTRLNLSPQQTADEGLVLAPRLSRLIGPVPRPILSDLAEVVEKPPGGDKLQDVAVPAAISGRIASPGEEDRYRLLVKPGMSLRFDVLANRLGSALDGVLSLRLENGTQVAFSDDRPDTVDPGFDYTVPAGVTALVLVLTDLHRKGGPDHYYRIAISPANAPDFALSVAEERVHLPFAGQILLSVRATRAGYNGPIAIRIPGLPAGVELRNATIPAGADSALVGLTTIGSAPKDLPQPIVTRVLGTAADPTLVRAADAVDNAVTRGQPWLRHDFGFAVVEPAPLRVEWAGSGILPLGAGLPEQVKVQRQAGATGAVRLTVLTTQTVPKRPDGQPDVNRALRLDGAPAIAADRNDLAIKVLVPGDLPPRPYDLALKAELLGAGGAVIATAYSDVQRLEPGPPFRIELAGDPAADAKAGRAARITGKLQRNGDFAKPVTLNLEFVDTGVILKTTVAPGQPTFEFPVVAPAKVQAGLKMKLKLVGVADEGTPAALRSNEIGLALEFPAK